MERRRRHDPSRLLLGYPSRVPPAFRLAVFFFGAVMATCTIDCTKEEATPPVVEPPPPPPPPPHGPTYHSKSIGGNEVWRPSGNPHIVLNEVVVSRSHVADDFSCATLEIRPGCVVRFARGASLGIVSFEYGYGGLDAIGTPDSVIVFTADAGADSVAPGYWAGLFASGPRSAPGGKRGSAGPRRSMSRTYPDNGLLRLAHCRIEWAGEPDGAAVNVEWDRELSMEDCTIRGSAGNGVHWGWYPSVFNGNTITDCAGYPIECNPSTDYGQLDPGFGGCSLSGNGHHAILLDRWFTGTGVEDARLRDLGIPYALRDGARLRVEGGGANGLARLTVEPGVTVLFGRGAGIDVGARYQGALVADGSEREIVLASASADPSPGDWNGLHFGCNTLDEQTRLVRCRVANAGGSDSGAIAIENARPTIQDCRIERNSGYGIKMFGRDVADLAVLRDHNTFARNTGGSVTWYPGPGWGSTMAPWPAPTSSRSASRFEGNAARSVRTP
jgi:hypothetical protein